MTRTVTIQFLESLTTATIRELKAICKDWKLSKYSSLNKAQLVTLIKANCTVQAVELGNESIDSLAVTHCPDEPTAVEAETLPILTAIAVAEATEETETTETTEAIPAPLDGAAYAAEFIPFPTVQGEAVTNALDWARFTAQAGISTARAIAHAPETKQLLHTLWLVLCTAIAATILAGRVCGRAWRSATAKRLRYQLERWFTGQILESLGTQPHAVLPLKPYDYGNNLSDLARSALS